ncbi:MAG TPA: hypothetical protein VK586_24475 [Streptosporangiaceae bacterium]|nr:hypothetical protein [Streptosporangiaceae bacterium]
MNPITFPPTASRCGRYTAAVAPVIAAATVTGRRRSTAGTARTGVTLVAMARPSSSPPPSRPVSPPGRARVSSAATVRNAASTSTCAPLPACRAVTGHHAHKTASRGSRPSRRSPPTSRKLVAMAHSAPAAWIGRDARPAGGASSLTAVK